MQRLSALTVLVLFLSLFANAKDERPTLKNCSTYRFLGVLSTDFSKGPKLSTFDLDGVPIDLTVHAKGLDSVELASLRGKNVIAEIEITKKEGTRIFEGNFKNVKLGVPPGLGAGAGNSLPVIVSSRAKCSCTT